MPGACLNSWQSNCDWTLGYLWHSWDFIQRGVFIALALMLVYTVLVIIRFSYRYSLLRRESGDFERDPPNFSRANTKFLANLVPAVAMVKGIASAAPYLGLVGTSYGISAGMSTGFAMEKSAAQRMLMTRIAASLIAAASGIVVAIPAALFCNLLHIRIETLSPRPSKRVRTESAQGSFHLAQTLALKKRFLASPAYALLAAPTLAFIVLLFTPFHPYRVPTGFPVSLLPIGCDQSPASTLPDRIIVLRITNSGEPFLNLEAEDWKSLQSRLSDIYRLRKKRAIYLLVEDQVPFQTVADAIDIARSSMVLGQDAPDAAVILLTPRAQADRQRCFVRNLNRLLRHPSK